MRIFDKALYCMICMAATASTTAAADNTRATVTELDADMWGYHCDVASWLGFPGETVGQVRVASEFGAELTERLAGTKIDRLGVVAPALYTTRRLKMSLFITYDLDGEPVAEIDYDTKGCTVDKMQEKVTAVKYDVVELEEPLTIEAGKPFYVGFKALDVKDNDLPVCYDGVACGGDALLMKVGEEGEWESLSEEYGSACFYIGLDRLPQDMLRVVKGVTPSQLMPGTPVDGQLTLFNIGGNEVTSIDGSVTIGGQTPYTFHCDKETQTLFRPEGKELVAGGIPVRSRGMAAFSGAPLTETGVLPVEISATGANGAGNGWPYNSLESAYRLASMEAGTGFSRNVVVEEGTGTWCGWCVRGYVGMEEMTKKYTDGSYIGIAGHSGDKMASESYQPVLDYYFGAFPVAMVNRTTEINPMPQIIEDSYLEARALPTYGRVGVEAEKIAGGFLHVSSDAEVYYPEDCILSYLIKENNVGPYKQSNNYAGGGSGEMGGFENQPGNVELMFNDVARDAVGPFGIENSLPEGMEAGQVYSHTAEIPLDNVGEIGNCHLVALLLNRHDGTVVNAAQVSLDKFNGVESVYGGDTGVRVRDGVISVEGDSPAEVYSLDGSRVAVIAPGRSFRPGPGVYVTRAAGATAKIIIR